ncbi:MAG: ABC transporter permease [Actinomycetota bacterium]
MSQVSSPADHVDEPSDDGTGDPDVTGDRDGADQRDGAGAHAAADTARPHGGSEADGTPTRLGLGGVVAALLLAAAVLLALVGPWIAPQPLGRTIGRPFDPDTGGWLGTGQLGTDIWSELLHGGRRIVVAPVVITALATLVGTTIGAFMAASRTANRVLRALDVVAVLPPLLVLLLLLYRFGDSLLVIGCSVVLVSAPFVARYMRSVAEPVLASDYVLNAQLVGEPRSVILWRHVLPNLTGPVLADAALRVAGTVYTVAAASFLGFGPPPPATDWAVMINEGAAGATLNAWALVAPGVAIAVFAISINLLGDRLATRWRSA